MRIVRRAFGSIAVMTVVAAAGLMGLMPFLGYPILVVRGASMGAAAPLGSVVVGQRLQPSEIRVGDVIVMTRAAEGRRRPLVMHRVVDLRVIDGQRVVTTRGDANATPDPTEYVVAGPTISPRWVIPGIGYAISLLATRAGFLLLVLLPAAGVTVMWLRLIWRVPSQGGRGDAVAA